jgi:hypothetical protein
MTPRSRAGVPGCLRERARLGQKECLLSALAGCLPIIGCLDERPTAMLIPLISLAVNVVMYFFGEGTKEHKSQGVDVARVTECRLAS